MLECGEASLVNILTTDIKPEQTEIKDRKEAERRVVTPIKQTLPLPSPA